MPGDHDLRTQFAHDDAILLLKNFRLTHRNINSHCPALIESHADEWRHDRPDIFGERIVLGAVNRSKRRLVPDLDQQIRPESAFRHNITLQLDRKRRITSSVVSFRIGVRIALPSLRRGRRYLLRERTVDVLLANIPRDPFRRAEMRKTSFRLPARECKRAEMRQLHEFSAQVAKRARHLQRRLIIFSRILGKPGQTIRVSHFR